MKLNFLSINNKMVQTAAIFSMVVGVLVIIGWIFDLDILKSVWPNLISMKANTAICFFLLGLATFLAARYPDNFAVRQVFAILALIVLALSIATIGEYVFGWRLPIDELFFKDDSAVSAAFPGRMSLITAINFILLSFGLLKTAVNDMANDIFIVIVFFSSLFYFNEYVFQDPSLYQEATFIPLALHTSITFIVLSLGILLMHSKSGISKIFVVDNLGGQVARKIIPVVLFLPSLSVWLEALAEKKHLFSEHFVHSGEAMANSLILGMIVLYNAYLIDRTELKREKDLELRQKAEKDLKNAMQEVEAKNAELDRINKIFVKREIEMASYKKEMSKDNSKAK